MSASVQLLFGADPAALEAAAHDLFAGALRTAQAQRDPGRTLWIAPTARARRAVLQQLTQSLGSICVAPGVLTFEQFAEELLKAAGRPATAISSMVRRLILRRLVADAHAAGELPYFAAVAETAGFLDIVEGLIVELKQDEIWPDQFLEHCRRHSVTAARDQEIGLLYQRYQDILQSQNWYDTEGRFWLARTMLLEDQCRGLPQWSQIAVVGFSDFTPPQQEILEELSHRSERLLLTIPSDQSDVRQELFARPTQTAAMWQRRFPMAEIVPLAPRTEEVSSRAVLRDRLFGNVREQTIAATADGVEIVAATGPESELSAVAIRIKALLRQGVPIQDIAVGVRSSTTDGLRWQRGLERRGLPAWCEVGPPIRETGFVKFLISLMLAESEDWPFHRLLAVFNSSYFRPVCPVVDERRFVAASLRRLQLSSDRRAILQVLPVDVDDAVSTKLAALNEDDATLARDQNWPAVHAAAGRFLRWYSALTESLRSSHPLCDWIDVLADLIQQTGTMSSPVIDPLDRCDVELWDRIQRMLRDAAAAELLARDQPRELPLADFLLEFRDLLARETCDPDPEHPGQLRILGVEQLRHLNAKVVILVGLTEDSFPRGRTDDCLFPDAERRRLSSAGLPLRHATHDQQDDLFLFWTLLQRWQQRLILSYAAVNPRGQPTFPSPYVTAMRGLFAPEALEVQEEGQLDPIPDPTHVLSSADQRLAAWNAARTGEPGWLRTLWQQRDLQPTWRCVSAAVEMAVARFHTAGFTAYEGRLDHDTNRQAIAKRFGVHRQFSATELERYAECPFRFWMETALGVAPVASVEVGTNHRDRGSLIHAVLAQLSPEIEAGVSGIDLSNRFRDLVATRLQKAVSATELQRALTRIERQLLDQWAEAYAEQCQRYTETFSEVDEHRWHVWETEVPFGDVPGSQAESPAPPLVFGAAARKVQVRGRIDRIDVGKLQNRPAFIVIDYKTGKRPKFSEDEVRSGKALQLVLYTAAVRRLGLAPADALPFQLGYWCLKETGFQGGLGSRAAASLKPLDAAVWETLESLLDDVIPQLATGIRQGEFVVENSDKDCTGRCPFQTVCRVNQIRPLAERLHKVRREFHSPAAAGESTATGPTKGKP